MNDDDGSPGYDTDYDPTADPHAPDIGGDAERPRYRELPQRLTSAENVTALVETMRLYGWLPPFLALLVQGGVRGVFEYLSEPFAVAHGYVFEGWLIALAINLAYGVFISGFLLFLYFGVIGAFAGLLSDTKDMETAIFKVGGYLLLIFVPLLAVSAAIAFTIPPSVAAVSSQSAPEFAEAHRSVAATLQMRVVGFVLAAGWIVIGFLMLPVVSELYDIGRKGSVASVLPVTLVAVIGTVLV